MEVAALKSELEALESKDRRRMIAFLLALEEKNNQAYRQELARRIDDKNPDHWATMDDLDRRLGLDGKKD